MNQDLFLIAALALVFFCLGLGIYALFSGINAASKPMVVEEMSAGGIVSKVATEVSPSVVGITNLSRDGKLFDRDYTETTGSGVIIDEEGYIVTNNHVVKNADRLIVTLADGNEEDAAVIGTDARTDLALIKIKVDNYVTPAEFGDSDRLVVGQGVVAIGNPLGLRFARSVTSGVVSGLNRLLTTEEGFAFRLIQTDAAINPGNSGGALVDLEGKLIGINTIKIAAQGYEGMGFSIPSNQVRRVVDDLKKYGKVRRPLLGIRILGEISQGEADLKDLKQCCGVIVEPIVGGTAYKAGIRSRDIIIQVDGEQVKTALELEEKITSKAVGETVSIVIARLPFIGEGQVQVKTIKVKLSE